MIDKENKLLIKLRNDEILIEVIKFCKSVKSTRKIIDHIHQLGSLGSKRSKVMLELSLKLNELEGLKALEYDYNSKSWIATKLGDRILKKYF
ncbi:MAG: hypothetical protein NWE86_00995 [Candidatus Bathyarchaeota archaeon]|nr:hypothetical protein [Candidatus Bathyarchaeota archaeon]